MKQSTASVDTDRSNGSLEKMLQERVQSQLVTYELISIKRSKIRDLDKIINEVGERLSLKENLLNLDQNI